MNRTWGILILVLAAALAAPLLAGVPPVWAQPEEEEEEPIQARPRPWDDGEHGDYFLLQDGRQALLLGGRLFIREGDRGLPAVDGAYPVDGGGSIIVSGGMATPGASGLGGEGAARGIIIINGRQAVMERGADGRSRLFFLQGGRKVPAADGPYTTSDGRAITVSGGIATPGASGLGGDGAARGIVIINGRQAVMEPGADGHNRLFFLQGDRKVPAANGRYTTSDGRAITVNGGRATFTAVRSPGVTRGAVQLPAVQTAPTSRVTTPSKLGASGPGGDAAARGIVIVNGRQAVMEPGADGRSRLFFLQGGRKVPAADGRYATSDGRAIIVSGGRATFAAAPAQRVSPGAGQLPAVRTR